MPMPICVKCEVEFRPKENDVRVVKWFSSPPRPCAIWCADLWTCPKCGIEIVVGFGRDSIAEHYQEDFEESLQNAEDNYTVINCYKYKGE